MSWNERDPGSPFGFGDRSILRRTLSGIRPRSIKANKSCLFFPSHFERHSINHPLPLQHRELTTTPSAPAFQVLEIHCIQATMTAAFARRADPSMLYCPPMTVATTMMNDDEYTIYSAATDVRLSAATRLNRVTLSSSSSDDLAAMAGDEAGLAIDSENPRDDRQRRRTVAKRRCPFGDLTNTTAAPRRIPSV
jgi:hypothetical protein